MNAIVIDTSVWIEFFRGKDLPLLENALEEGRVLISPVVIAELMSGLLKPREEKHIREFLQELEMIACDFHHWSSVGLLRSKMMRKGVSLSTPDAHIAQCAIDRNCHLYSFDQIFKKISSWVSLKCIE